MSRKPDRPALRSRLKNVVLPTPEGPLRAKIFPIRNTPFALAFFGAARSPPFYAAGAPSSSTRSRRAPYRELRDRTPRNFTTTLSRSVQPTPLARVHVSTQSTANERSGKAVLLECDS